MLAWVIQSILFLGFIYYLFYYRCGKKKAITIFNSTKNESLADDARAAFTFFERAVGLLNHSKLPHRSALYLSPCKIIHMKNMAFPIDVVFINTAGKVVRLYPEIRPDSKKKFHGGLSASAAIELPIGTISKTNTQLGDFIEIKETSSDQSTRADWDAPIW